VEGWVDLGTAVKVRSQCPRLYIAAAVAINTYCQRRDSNLGPLTPQSDSQPLGHCDLSSISVVSQKWCKIYMLLLRTTNRKCHMAYWIVSFAMTLSDLEGHSAVLRLTNGIRWIFMQNFARFQLIQRVARSLGDSWASYQSTRRYLLNVVRQRFW